MSIREDFLKNGFVVEQGCFTSEEINNIKENIVRYIKEVVPKMPQKMVYYEDIEEHQSLKQIQLMHTFDPFFKQLANSDKIVSIAKECLGGDVRLENVQYFNKYPGKNNATPAHQDGFYFHIKPQEALTMWLSLGKANKENGAVQYIPGSHNKGMRPHGRSQVLGFSQTITDWNVDDTNALLQMEADAGDLLAHHSLTIHSAPSNTSQRDRKSIGFIFYRKDVEIDNESHSKYQKQLANRLVSEGKI